MSLTALREIFRDFSSADLPNHLAQCLAGDTHAIATNRVANADLEHRREERRISAHFTQPTTNPLACSTIAPAIPDRRRSDHIRVTPDPSPPPPPAPLLVPSSHTPSTEPAATVDPGESTVPSPSRASPRPVCDMTAPQHALTYCTGIPTTPHQPHQPNKPTVCLPATVGAFPATPPDLLLQLLPTDRPDASQSHLTRNWEAHLLFPEISAPTHSNPQAPLPKSTDSQANTPIPPPQVTPHLPPRTARIKTTRSNKRNSPVLDLEPRDFYDVPLEYAEGRELLSLIGAVDVAIPPNLISPPSAPADLGQTSRSGPKNSSKPPLPGRSKPTSLTQPPAQPTPLHTATVSTHPPAQTLAQPAALHIGHPATVLAQTPLPPTSADKPLPQSHTNDPIPDPPHCAVRPDTNA